MNFVFEFVDQNGNPVELTKEQQQEALLEKIDRAMTHLGFQRVEKTKEPQ